MDLREIYRKAKYYGTTLTQEEERAISRDTGKYGKAYKKLIDTVEEKPMGLKEFKYYANKLVLQEERKPKSNNKISPLNQFKMDLDDAIENKFNLDTADSVAELQSIDFIALRSFIINYIKKYPKLGNYKGYLINRFADAQGILSIYIILSTM